MKKKSIDQIKYLNPQIAADPQTGHPDSFTMPGQEPKQFELLAAKLREIVGETDADGMPCVVTPQMFESLYPNNCPEHFEPRMALSRFRPPIEIGVKRSDERPNFIFFRKKYLRILAAHGPRCRSRHPDNPSLECVREEWDVIFSTTEGIGYYRIYFDGIKKKWFMDGMYD